MIDDPILIYVLDSSCGKVTLKVEPWPSLLSTRIWPWWVSQMALAIANQTPLDLVLLDIGLPSIGGAETCRQLKLSHPNLPILILTSRDDPELLTRLIQLGVQGYCLKGIAAETLILAVRSVAAGASWWDATATQTIRKTLADVPAHLGTVHHNPLTPREQEVLTLIARDKTNGEIAQILYISPGTVRVHVHSILHKLEVGDRAQAVVAAQEYC